MSNIRSIGSAVAEPSLIGESPATQLLRATIDQVARGDAKVLITGESGVGKDIVSRCLHARSSRRSQPFIAVNCAAVPDSLLESELFGHVRGSFTGAYRDKTGKLQLAHNGTVFLDEVGEMNLRMQALLLRFLENGEIQPVGSDSAVRTVNVRVVAATNRDLADLIATGRFREDLMYRLKVVHLHVPPLRERKDDIRPLVEFMIERSGRDVTFTDEAMRALIRYRWPGNVRELQNVVEQMAWMVPGGVVGLEHLPPAIRQADPVPVMPMRERRRQIADELYDGLLTGTYGFWNHIHATVPRSRYHAARSATARSPRPGDHGRQLPRDAEALRHAGPRLQAVAQLPRGARLRGRLPAVPVGPDAAVGGDLESARHRPRARQRTILIKARSR